MSSATDRVVMSFSDAALWASLAAFAAGVAAASAPADAAPPAYVNAGSFQLPTAASVFTDGADGRLVCITETGAIVQQTASNGSVYSPLGSLPAGSVPNYGAGFITISPDGGRLAIGDNGAANAIHVVSAASLNASGPTTPQTIAAPNFDGAWADNATLYVNGSPSFGTAPNLYRVNLTTSTATPVVTGIGDGSGGVSIRGGRVYTAIGFDAAGVLDGQVRSFAVSTLNAAAAPIAFSTGLLAAQASTGNSLDFDTAGNLVEAGFGGVAVIDLATQQRYDLPGLSATGFYTAAFNEGTGEILVRDFGAQTVLRYAVPAPTAGGVLVLCGVAALRRRRHA